MPRFVSTARDVLRRLVADAPSVTPAVRAGRRELLRGEGASSLFAWPFLALAKRIKGKEKVNEALYERLHRPLKNLDEKAGRALAKHLGAPNVFRHVDVLPTARRIGGNR